MCVCVCIKESRKDTVCVVSNLTAGYILQVRYHTTKEHTQQVESRFGPKRGFGVTPGELLTISKPNHYPKSEKPPGPKGFTNPNL